LGLAGAANEGPLTGGTARFVSESPQTLAPLDSLQPQIFMNPHARSWPPFSKGRCDLCSSTGTASCNVPEGSDDYICTCKPGSIGKNCEMCADNFMVPIVWAFWGVMGALGR
jgi:hypothetical protein